MGCCGDAWEVRQEPTRDATGYITGNHGIWVRPKLRTASNSYVIGEIDDKPENVGIPHFRKTHMAHGYKNSYPQYEVSNNISQTLLNR